MELRSKKSLYQALFTLLFIASTLTAQVKADCETVLLPAYDPVESVSADGFRFKYLDSDSFPFVSGNKVEASFAAQHYEIHGRDDSSFTAFAKSLTEYDPKGELPEGGSLLNVRILEIGERSISVIQQSTGKTREFRIGNLHLSGVLNPRWERRNAGKKVNVQVGDHVVMRVHSREGVVDAWDSYLIEPSPQSILETRAVEKKVEALLTQLSADIDHLKSTGMGGRAIREKYALMVDLQPGREQLKKAKEVYFSIPDNEKPVNILGGFGSPIGEVRFLQSQALVSSYTEELKKDFGIELGVMSGSEFKKFAMKAVLTPDDPNGYNPAGYVFLKVARKMMDPESVKLVGKEFVFDIFRTYIETRLKTLESLPKIEDSYDMDVYLGTTVRAIADYAYISKEANDLVSDARLLRDRKQRTIAFYKRFRKMVSDPNTLKKVQTAMKESFDMEFLY